MKWTDDLDKRLWARYLSGASYARLAEEFGATIGSIRSRLWRIRPKMAHSEDADIERLIEAAMRFHVAAGDTDPVDVDPIIDLSDRTGWIGVVWMADWHVGNLHTLIDRLQHDLQLIESDDRLFVAFGGDAIEGFSGAFAAGVEDQSLTVTIQRRIVDYFFDRIKARILLICIGCHETWAQTAAGYDFMAYLKEKNPSMKYLGSGGRYKLRLRGGELTGVLRHRGRGYSYLNPLHPCLREVREFNQDADIVVIGHSHEMAVGLIPVAGKIRYMCRPGTYKITDRYSNKHGFGRNESSLGAPAALINTETLEIRIATSVENALDQLKSL